MLDNSAVVRISIAGKFLSSSINTEENCWFSILAFSGSVTDSSSVEELSGSHFYGNSMHASGQILGNHE